MAIRHWSVVDDAVNYSFKGFFALEHESDKLSLEVVLICDHEVLERLMDAINSHLELASSELHNHFLCSDKENITLDPLDWNSDTHLLDMLLNLLVHILIWSWTEWNRCIKEELLALLVNLLLCVPSDCLVQE